MTKQLEEEFDLPQDDIEEELHNFQDSLDQKQKDANSLIDQLSNAEKIDVALNVISDLEDYKDDMDEISREAMESYKKIITLGMHAPIGNASRILEVANNMLRTALDARTSKAGTKLKVIELQLRKEKIDVDKGDSVGGGPGLTHREMIELVSKSISGPDKNKSKNDK